MFEAGKSHGFWTSAKGRELNTLKVAQPMGKRGDISNLVEFDSFACSARFADTLSTNNRENS